MECQSISQHAKQEHGKGWTDFNFKNIERTTKIQGVHWWLSRNRLNNTPSWDIIHSQLDRLKLLSSHCHLEVPIPACNMLFLKFETCLNLYNKIEYDYIILLSQYIGTCRRYQRPNLGAISNNFGIALGWKWAPNIWHKLPRWHRLIRLNSSGVVCRGTHRQGNKSSLRTKDSYPAPLQSHKLNSVGKCNNSPTFQQLQCMEAEDRHKLACRR